MVNFGDEESLSAAGRRRHDGNPIYNRYPDGEQLLEETVVEWSVRWNRPAQTNRCHGCS